MIRTVVGVGGVAALLGQETHGNGCCLRYRDLGFAGMVAVVAVVVVAVVGRYHFTAAACPCSHAPLRRQPGSLRQKQNVVGASGVGTGGVVTADGCGFRGLMGVFGIVI